MNEVVIGMYHRLKTSGKGEKNDEHVFDELKRLRKEVARLEEERAILKKAAAFMPCGYSLQEKVSKIQVPQRQPEELQYRSYVQGYVCIKHWL
ncbi:MAG: transposase [Endozoicomonas sp.]